MSDAMLRAAARTMTGIVELETSAWIRVAVLQAELAQDLAFIETNYQKNREMTRRVESADIPDEFDYAALGYTLHNLYGAVESYCLRIAKFFENNLDQSTWLRSLVERMTLDIHGIRPALLTQDDRIVVEELMRFRHLFRNLYKTPLVPEELLYANRQAAGLDRLMSARHTAVNSFLDALTRELDGE